MGPGHFTNGGHFIILRGVTLDGSVLVADPASQERSLTTWDPCATYDAGVDRCQSLFSISMCLEWRGGFLPCKAKIQLEDGLLAHGDQHPQGNLVVAVHRFAQLPAQVHGSPERSPGRRGRPPTPARRGPPAGCWSGWWSWTGG